MSHLRIASTSGLIAAIVVSAVPPLAAQPFDLAVKKDKLFGSSRGRLVFAVDHVVYEDIDSQETRQWDYEDVKQIQIVSPTHVRLATYEDQGWIRLGRDRMFDFEVTGEPVSEDLVTFLLNRTPQPLVTAVVPPVDSEPIFRIPVKLRRRIRGSQGSLDLQADRLVYRTEREDHARVWRLADLYLVFQPDRHRLTVQAYEGGSDRTRAFEFDLKRPLPSGALEAIWSGMYGPSHAHDSPRK